MNRSSFYTKMILFGCVLSILPVLIIGFFSYMKSAASVERQVNKSNIEILKQTKGNMEQVLKALDYTMNYVTNSSMMEELLYRNMDYKDFQFYNTLRRELGLLQSFDTKVTDVIFVNKANNWIINNRGLYQLNQVPERDVLLSFMDLPYNSNWIIRENSELGSLDTEAYACKYTISLVKKLPQLRSEKRGLAFAHIPECSLSAMLDESNNAKNDMVLDPQYRIIIHPNMELIGKTIWEAGYIKEDQLTLLQKESGQFQLDSEMSGQAFVSYERSNYNGWIYLSLTDISAITQESRAIGWFTVWVMIIILVLSLLTVYFGTRRMYSPIRGIVTSIRQHLEDTSNEAAPRGRNDLQLIGEHIEQMSRSNTSLKKELQISSEQIRRFFLMKLYQGNVKPSELEEYVKMYGYAKQLADWRHLNMLVIQIDLYESTRYEIKDLDLLLFAMNNIVEEIIPADNRLAPVVLEQSQIVLFGNTESDLETFQRQTYELAESIQKSIRSFLDLDISIGISLPFYKLKSASRAYKEGVEALKQRLRLGEGVIVPYSGINSGKHTLIFPFPKQLKNELFDAIKLAEEDKAAESLKMWMEEVLQEDRSPHEYQISLFRLLNELMVMLQESGITLPQLGITEGNLHEELTKLFIRSEIESWFKNRLILPMIREFRDRRESQYHNLSSQLIDMIQQRYDEDLTLEECATKMHYNTFYLSSVFKKETNMTFSEYLTMYRFKKAKEWLVETEMPIKDIAQKLCYNNPQNFIRSFRKQEGMTPGQYRTLYSSQVQ